MRNSEGSFKVDLGMQSCWRMAVYPKSEANIRALKSKGEEVAFATP